MDVLAILARAWVSWALFHYDFVGMIHMLRACLGNLASYSMDADWVQAQDIFEPSEIDMLKRLLDAAMTAPEDD